jgi:hypothetical protein
MRRISHPRSEKWNAAHRVCGAILKVYCPARCSQSMQHLAKLIISALSFKQQIRRNSGAQSVASAHRRFGRFRKPPKGLAIKPQMSVITTQQGRQITTCTLSLKTFYNKYEKESQLISKNCLFSKKSTLQTLCTSCPAEKFILITALGSFSHEWRTAPQSALLLVPCDVHQFKCWTGWSLSRSLDSQHARMINHWALAPWARVICVCCCHRCLYSHIQRSGERAIKPIWAFSMRVCFSCINLTLYAGLTS